VERGELERSKQALQGGERVVGQLSGISGRLLVISGQEKTGSHSSAAEFPGGVGLFNF